MTLKQKILLLGAVPVLLMALVVNLSNYMVSKSDLESELVVARENAIKERKALLSSYIMMAKTAVDAVYAQPDSPENRQKVKELLRPLRYGSDGYFFVYDFEGNTILLPTRAELEGKNRWNDKDAKGKLLIQDIIKVARQGMALPSTGRPNLPLVVMLPSSPTTLRSTNTSGLSVPVSISMTSTTSWRPCAPSAKAICTSRCRAVCW